MFNSNSSFFNDKVSANDNLLLTVGGGVGTVLIGGIIYLYDIIDHLIGENTNLKKENEKLRVVSSSEQLFNKCDKNSIKDKMANHVDKLFVWFESSMLHK